MSSRTLIVVAFVLLPVQAWAGERGGVETVDDSVELVPSPDAWAERERRSLRRGARAVPSAVRRAAGPIRFRRVDRGCPYGMGAYTDTCPTFDPDDSDTFLIYDAPPIQGIGPPRRLSSLDERERRDLVLRRAVVHAFFAKFERTREWAREEQWRRLNRWRGGDWPGNRDPWGFSRLLGMHSAHLDLVTFLEEYLVRPEDVLRESEAADAPEDLEGRDENRTVQCQEFSKMRFVAERLEAYGDGWSPREQVDRFPTGCEAFDQWARLDELEGIDLLFAAATADRPQSLWGHLLLHIRHGDTPEGFESVYQFGAVSGTEIEAFEYLTRGLFGGFYSVFDPVTFRTADRTILQYQQRSLRRYRLQLSRTQQLRLLQRIWEVERRHRRPYWFFDNNCAGFLADLVQTALVDVEIPERSHFIVAPTDVLDLLAGVDNGEQGRLLKKRPADAFSNRAFAEWAHRHRSRHLQAIVDELRETEPQLVEKLQAASGDLTATDPDVRREGYQRIGRLLEKAVRRIRADSTEADAESDGEVGPWVGRAAAFLYYSMRIERYYVETRLYQSREILAEAEIDPPVRTPEQILAWRRELYRHEDLERRRRQRRERQARHLRRFNRAERRSLTDSEQAVLDRERRARGAYEAVITAKRRLVDHLSPDFQPLQFFERRREQFRRERAEHDARSVGSSGKGRLTVAGHAIRPFDGASWELGLEYAFLNERLGSQRRRGFRSDIETQVFDLKLDVPVHSGALGNLDVDLVLLRYLTVEQLLAPARQNLLDVFGYGFDLRAGHDGRRNVDASFQGSVGLSYPLLADESFENYLVVAMFPGARWLTTGADDYTFTGVWGQVYAQMHLYGNYANVFQFEGGIMPMLQFPGREFRYEGLAEVSTRHAVGALDGQPLVVGPRLQIEWTELLFEGATDPLEVQVGLQVELPL